MATMWTGCSVLKLVLLLAKFFERTEASVSKVFAYSFPLIKFFGVLIPFLNDPSLPLIIFPKQYIFKLYCPVTIKHPPLNYYALDAMEIGTPANHQQWKEGRGMR